MKKIFKWANSKSATILTLMSVAILVLTFSGLSFSEGKKKGIEDKNKEIIKTKLEEQQKCQNTIDDRVKIEIKKMLPIELKKVR